MSISIANVIVLKDFPRTDLSLSEEEYSMRVNRAISSDEIYLARHPTSRHAYSIANNVRKAALLAIAYKIGVRNLIAKSAIIGSGSVEDWTAAGGEVLSIDESEQVSRYSEMLVSGSLSSHYGNIVDILGHDYNPSA